ncbi:neuropilin and tolloid-like protein 1 [Contarinia nasturtii]|uniref:neuropilin and tolloid-like protein 1 n=1 Tax=Contarinia nasturtii TaxID=265458 RepID=UPI0012D410D8|nr:neuropilin and tolloid-like protein 1 [Contarinia nasturtii]
MDWLQCVDPVLLKTAALSGSMTVHASTQTSITLGNKLRSKRSQGEVSESDENICQRFSCPLENNTFFSPIDTTTLSDNYPPTTSCTLLLTADPGYIVKLEFRNRFNIEPSPACEYDYLEIRDGKYGFSTLKGRYCGTKFPDEIISSDRYLWLRFHSDDNIGYEGFEAVYEFIPRLKKMDAIEECSIVTNDENSGQISIEDISETILGQVTEIIPLDCLWTIRVKEDWQIMLSVDKFDLEKKNDCKNNFLDIIGNNTNVSEPTKHFCGVVAEPHESKSNTLYVRFFATKQGLKSKFSLSYTAFTKKKAVDGKNSTPTCGENEFDCDDETCIDMSLYCNEHPNCKFRKDEGSDCPYHIKEDDEKKDLWLIIAVFSALLGAMTSVFLFNCIRTLIRDQKIIRETIRQSKESKLDEAGRMSIKRSLENVNRIIPGIRARDGDEGFGFKLIIQQ